MVGCLGRHQSFALKKLQFCSRIEFGSTNLMETSQPAMACVPHTTAVNSRLNLWVGF